MASHSIDAGLSDHPVPVSSSSSSGFCKVPAIFLSHSGRQKPFVERLNEALLKVNHISFFDQHSLQKGSPFPERIMIAARECTLGVVVLSDDFLTSRWPLMELEILVQRRGPEAKVLPLFYKLVPEDLKSPTKLVEWRKKWKKLAREPGDVAKWEKAVKVLRSFNGEIFEQGTSEARYIKRVVQSICNQVPCPLPYDMSMIRGHRRLAEEVARQFDHLRHEQQDGGACMVGLHGVGGVGKSIMCKALVNFYWSEYPGKSHHLELPTNGSNMEIIVQKCKKMLELIAGLDEKLLKNLDDIDQVVGLMKEHLPQHDVFLAIDNVWESSREVAGRILKVGFSSKSKILVTSRSEEILKDFFSDQKNSCVGPVPAPEHSEALQIFQEALEQVSPSSLVMERHLVDGALWRCKFDGSYHALALKALSLHVKNACRLEGWQHLSQILREIKGVDLPKGVEDVIRRSYDSLEEQKKRMFLDIAVLQTMREDFHKCKFRFFGGEQADERDSGGLTTEKARQWLSFLYKGQHPKGKADVNLNATIYELCLGGLLQLETDGVTGETIIRVHDLLSDLAESEAARSSRFFIAGKSSHAVEEIHWQQLGRVILHEFCEPQVVEQLLRQDCRRLQVLDARGVEFSKGIDMCLMPALCVLKLRDVSLRCVSNWPASALVIIDLSNVRFQQPFGSMPITQHSGVMNLEDVAELQMLAMEGIEGLGALKMLRSLRVAECQSLKRTPDLSGMAELDVLSLEGNGSMEEVGGLSSSLRRVEIRECGALERVPDMSGLTRLERLGIGGCGSLKRIPDLSGLVRLDVLSLERNRSMEEVGCLSSSLRCLEIKECGVLERVPDMSGLTLLERLQIGWCRSLKRIPDLSGLARLDMLSLEGNGSMEEVGGLSSSLRHVEFRQCRALDRVPDMSGLTRLERLRIGGCGSLKRIPDLSSLARLDLLSLEGNRSMEEVGGLSSSLRRVEIRECGALERVPDMSGLTRLERLGIGGCGSLKRIPDLSGLAGLDVLSLERNEVMEEVGGLSSSLRRIEIWQCVALERVPDMSGLTRLERLRIVGCGSLKRIPDWSGHIGRDVQSLDGNGSMEAGGLSFSLRRVEILQCGGLERVPDMSGLTRLKRLQIGGCGSLKRIPDLGGLAGLDVLSLEGNEAMEEVGGFSSSLRCVEIWQCGALESVPDMRGLTRLETLGIGGCGSLKRMPDLSGLAGLDKLRLWGNGSMEEVGGLSSSLRRVKIGRCDALKKLPDISGLTRLERLSLRKNRGLEEVEGQSVSSTLTELDVRGCQRLRSFPREFERLCVHLSRAK